MRRALALPVCFLLAACGTPGGEPPAPAQGATNAPQSRYCAPREKLVEILARYGESRAGAGPGNGVLVELFKTPNGETWSIALTYPGGLSCLVGVGEDWVSIEDERGGV